MIYRDKNFFFSVDESGMHVPFLQFQERHFLHQMELRNGKPRGSHLCIPVYNVPPEGSVLHGEMPRHGVFRKKDFELVRNDFKWNGIGCNFQLTPGKDDEYIWPIHGQVNHIVHNNVLRIDVELWRTKDSLPGAAPVNIAKHYYFCNRGWITVRMGEYQQTISAAQPEPIIVPYTGPVKLFLSGIGKVRMAMDSNFVYDPQLVIWSDSANYTAFELVMGDPKLYDSLNGRVLSSDSKPISASFIMEFSLT